MNSSGPLGNGRIRWIFGVAGSLIVLAVSGWFATINSTLSGVRDEAGRSSYNITQYRIELDQHKALNTAMQTTIQTMQITIAQQEQRLIATSAAVEAQARVEQDTTRKIDDVLRIVNDIRVQLGPRK